MRSFLRKFRSLLCLVIISLLFSNCSTRKVVLTSDVKNTEVTIGDKGCVTPCSLKFSKEETIVHFITPDQREKTLTLPQPPNKWETTKSSMCHVFGSTFEVLSYPFWAIAIVGSISLSTMSDDDDDIDNKDYVNNKDSSDDGDLPEKVLLYTAGSLLTAFSLSSLSDYFKGKVLKPETVEVNFDLERTEIFR